MSDDDALLAAILRRFLTEPQPGYNSPSYRHLLGDELCLDGNVEVTPEEYAMLVRLGVEE